VLGWCYEHIVLVPD